MSGSKPHSKGEAFSRFLYARVARSQARRAIRSEMARAVKRAYIGSGTSAGARGQSLG